MCLPPPPFHEDQMTLGYKSCVQSSHHERSIGFPLFFFLFFFFLKRTNNLPYLSLSLFKSKEKRRDLEGGSREKRESGLDFYKIFFFFKTHYYVQESSALSSYLFDSSRWIRLPRSGNWLGLGRKGRGRWFSGSTRATNAREW